MLGQVNRGALGGDSRLSRYSAVSASSPPVCVAPFTQPVVRSAPISAMPKRKCTPEEEVRNLNLRASESRMKIGRRKIEVAMANCPSCIPHIVELLSNLGYDDEKIAKKEVMPESYQRTAARQRTNHEENTPNKSEPGDDDDAKSPGVQTVAYIDPVPFTYWRVDSLSKSLLRDKIICYSDPQALSKPNLRATLDPQGTAKAKVELLRIWEFCTGLPAEFSLTGDYRDFAKVQEIGAARALARGRRALTMALPPDWSIVGVYTIVGADPNQRNILVEHRFTKHTAQISMAKLPSCADISELSITKNWSERSASIVNSTNIDEGSAYTLANDFTQQTFGDEALQPASFYNITVPGGTSSGGGGSSIAARSDGSSALMQAPVVGFTTPTKASTKVQPKSECASPTSAAKLARMRPMRASHRVPPPPS